MHSGIVNGYQLLCDAHTVLEPHRGTAAVIENTCTSLQIGYEKKQTDELENSMFCRFIDF